jgi:hypothetical protein
MYTMEELYLYVQEFQTLQYQQYNQDTYQQTAEGYY